MKKTLAFLLTLMLLFSLSTTAFADTGGNQTITLTVPDSTTIEITPTVKMTLPVLGEHPSRTGTPIGDGASCYRVDNILYSKDGEGLTNDAVFDAGEYTITIVTVITDNDYSFSSSPATVVSDADDTVTFSASYDGSATQAAYTFTYTLADAPSPSWTLTIPADMSIDYGDTQTEIDLDNGVSINNIKNLPNTQRVDAYFQFTGSFVNTEESSKTIPFTVINTTNGSAAVLAAGSEHLIKYTRWEELSSMPANWSTGEEITSVTINITEQDWGAAAPGTYTTTFTYSSSVGSYY